MNNLIKTLIAASTVILLALANHTWLIQQACWNGLIEDSDAEYIGALLDGKL